MNGAKIQLSAEELQLVQNAGWVLTKNKIIEKVIGLFGILSEEMQRSLQTVKLPEAILQTTPKISKGEQYKGLPYVMLDYPRLFTKKDVFAIRTFFWWGNYFSLTLHLKGAYKDLFAETIKKNKILFYNNNFQVCISNNEWEHELNEVNYTPLQSIDTTTTDAMITQAEFLKFSAKIPLHQWSDAEVILGKLFHALLEMLTL